MIIDTVINLFPDKKRIPMEQPCHCQLPVFFSHVLQSRIQQWAWAPYCWSVTALLTI